MESECEINYISDEFIHKYKIAWKDKLWKQLEYYMQILRKIDA
jgi:hypothetical protein